MGARGGGSRRGSCGHTQGKCTQMKRERRREPVRAGASVQWLARGRWFGPGEGHKRENGRRRRLRSAGGGPSRLPPRQKDACLDAGGGCGVSVAGGDQGSIAARKRGACARVVHVRRTSASRESLRSQRKSRKARAEEEGARVVRRHGWRRRRRRGRRKRRQRQKWRRRRWRRRGWQSGVTRPASPTLFSLRLPFPEEIDLFRK